MSMQRSILLARLKDAYEANRIPVDPATALLHKSLPTHKLLENCMYWEANARGENPYDAIETNDALASLRLAGRRRQRDGNCPHARSGGATAIARSENQYHGHRNFSW